MKIYTCRAQDCDKIYERYKQDAEEIEKLIELAEKNYIQIEQLRQAYVFSSIKPKTTRQKKERTGIVHRFFIKHLND